MQIDQEKNETKNDDKAGEDQPCFGYFHEDTAEEKEDAYRYFARWLTQSAQVFVSYEIDQ